MWHRRGPELRPITVRNEPLRCGHDVRVIGGKWAGAFGRCIAVRKDRTAARIETALTGQVWLPIDHVEPIRWPEANPNPSRKRGSPRSAPRNRR